MGRIEWLLAPSKHHLKLAQPDALNLEILPCPSPELKIQKKPPVIQLHFYSAVAGIGVFVSATLSILGFAYVCVIKVLERRWQLTIQ